MTTDLAEQEYVTLAHQPYLPEYNPVGVLPAPQVMRDLFGDELGAGILGFVHHMEEVRDAFSEIREAWAEVGAEWEHMHDRPGEIIQVKLQQCAASICLDTGLLLLPEDSLDS